MKRFIDLRGQDTGYRFAWYDTIVDEFESVAGYEAWDAWEDFVDSATVAEWHTSNLDRYRKLCPAWVFKEPPEEDPL